MISKSLFSIFYIGCFCLVGSVFSACAQMRPLQQYEEKLEQENKKSGEKEQTDKPKELQKNQEDFMCPLGAVNQESQDYCNHVASEIGRVWNPPTSVPKGTTCSIKVVLDNVGKVEKYEIIQKSNEMIFDLSILRIIHLLKFHKSLCEKTFVVNFCQ
ncbi:MAG: TonB C-terminal domain-containing protein [bacterium]